MEVLAAVVIVISGLSLSLYFAETSALGNEAKRLGFTGSARVWVRRTAEGRFVLDTEDRTLMWINGQSYPISIIPHPESRTWAMMTQGSRIDAAFLLTPDNVESRSFLQYSLRQELIRPKPNVTVRGQRIIVPAPSSDLLYKALKRIRIIHQELVRQPSFEERCVEMVLNDPNAGVRSRYLRALLQSESWDLLWTTIRTLIESGQTDIFLTLIRHLKTHDREKAVNYLRGWLRSDRHDLRGAAAVALADLADTGTLKDQWGVFDELDQRQKILYLRACRSMGVCVEQNLIGLLMANDSLEVKRQAISSLKECGSSLAIEPLMKLKQDRRSGVMRHQIVTTLKAIRNQATDVQAGLISPATSDLDQGAISVAEDP